MNFLFEDIPDGSPAGRFLTYLKDKTVSPKQYLAEFSQQLSRSHQVDLEVWQLAARAWASPVVPTTGEMAQFFSKFTECFALGVDTRSMFARVRLRPRQQPVVLLNILATDLQQGPWMVCLIAAVHSGGRHAVQQWALDKLTTTGAQLLADKLTSPEDAFVLLRQASEAAEGFVSDLVAVSTNRYWSAIPPFRPNLFLEVSAMTTILDRRVVDDTWLQILTHARQYQIPILHPATQARHGIGWSGTPTSTDTDSGIVTTVEEFLKIINNDFATEAPSEENQQILDAACNSSRYPRNTPEQVQRVLGDAITKCQQHLDLQGRVVIINIVDNLRGMIELGSFFSIPFPSALELCCMCCVCSGYAVSCERQSDKIVAIQTPTGLFTLACFQDITAEVKWSLQDVRLQHISTKQIFSYANDSAEPHLHDRAGTGPYINRALDERDDIIGVIEPRRGKLEAICLARGEVIVANYSRILANLMDCSRGDPCHHSLTNSRYDEDDSGIIGASEHYSYITPDLVIKGIKQGGVCYGDWRPSARLYILGDSNDWKILCLATTPDVPFLPNVAQCPRCVASKLETSGTRTVISFLPITTRRRGFRFQ